ncbi:MAG: fibrobacter succinogenes major paralogous domain-containing protein, partial [Bacteroidales bacterium]|nr:fibrobacter succinogenes major paralogous domain-containing protein [Bacteroidales bacterium]
PTLFSGNYNDLTNKPTLFDGNYNSLINKPNLATVATTGNYNDLTNKPTIPAEPNDATLTIKRNGSTVGTFTANASANKTINITVPTTTAELTNNSGFITAEDLPSVPTQVSELDNDAGYVTQAQLNNAHYITNTGTSCDNSVDLCNLLSTIESLQAQVQALASSTISNDTCPKKAVVIDGAPNVCYFGPEYANIQLTAWVDGVYDLSADYAWFESGQYRPNVMGSDNNYIETWTPTYNNPLQFTVKVIRADGCSYLSAPFEVNVYDKPYATVTGSAGEVCAGEEVTLRANLYNYNDPMITYQWYENTVNSSHALTGRTHEVETFAPALGTTDYIVKVTHLLNYGGVNECFVLDTFRVEVSDCVPGGDSGCCSALSDAIDTLREMISHLNYVIDTLTFHCGTSTVTDHEGNVYATVQIGSQCWMRDNLRTTTSPSTGTYLIPAAGTGYTFTGKQARWYNNDSATYAPMNYGLLYNWNAAVDTFNTAYGETSVNTSFSYAVSVNFTGRRRGICPTGWHLPSDAEWTQLTNYVSSQSEYTCGDSSNIAKALAATTGWNTSTNTCAVGNDQSSNNATGFEALPAGYCYSTSFTNAGSDAHFWSSTQHESNIFNACSRNLSYYDAFVKKLGNGMNYGRSVRCLRD